MTAQVGWIGSKEKYVGEIVPVFQSAEARDKHEGTNVIRNNLGQSYLALVYYRGHDDFHRSYDLLDSTNSLPDWEKFRLSHRPSSRIVMATMTCAANLDGHAKIPAVTYRETDKHRLITSTTGSATECARLLGCPEIKGDTEDIADWVVGKGLENLPETLRQIAQVPCSMNMVFTLFEKPADDLRVYLLHSKSKTEPSRPYFSYTQTKLGLIYSSLPEEANSLMSGDFKSVPEGSVESLVVPTNEVE